MLRFLLFATLVSIISAASIRNDMQEIIVIPILKQGEEKNPDGSFNYFYEAGDGSKREESGFFKNQGTDDEMLVVKGSYHYIDANGDEVLVEYVADENGFQPTGTIINKEISQAAAEAAVKASLERSLQ